MKRNRFALIDISTEIINEFFRESDQGVSAVSQGGSPQSLCLLPHRPSHLWRTLTLLVLIALLAGLPQAFGQLAPSGEHYAGRPTDTGYGGNAVDAAGNLPASIPLDLPPVRGGLPLPLQIVYGPHHMGAAGLGWDIPLSYVQQNSTFAHRRPASAPGVTPVPRQRTTLYLLGQSADLIQQGELWVARVGTLELTVRQNGNSWFAYDGQGRTYDFESQSTLAGLWLLKSISAAGGTTVQLSYDITELPINKGTPGIEGTSGTAINLVSIAYNSQASETYGGSCAKNRISLTYITPQTSPLSMSILNDHVLVRNTNLALLTVMSRASCLAGYQRLRLYTFGYIPDADTALPQLANVRMLGREGTPEATIALPVAAYEYGSATSATPKGPVLRYARTPDIPMPTGFSPGDVSGTSTDSINAPESGQGYAMWQTLTDFDGDGRPDLVFKKDNKLWMAKSRPTSDGSTTFAVGPIGPLSDATLRTGAVATQSMTTTRFLYGSANRNTNDTWRQAIDVNGDGRIDIVDAAEEAGHWVVYLNTPGGPSGVKWERRSYSVAKLLKTLTDAKHIINGNHLPLSRQATGVSLHRTQCWKWDGKKWNWWPEGFGHAEVCPAEDKIQDYGAESTYVEWQLLDMNGDGYPDFVFDSTPVDFQLVPPQIDGTVKGQPYGGLTWVNFGPRGGADPREPANEVLAAFNVLGVRFDENAEVFSAPTPLNASASNLGVSQWVCEINTLNNQCLDSYQQHQSAGFSDVNGDGLVDRIVGKQAYLGTYSGVASSGGKVFIAAFSPIYISLPGYLATQFSTHNKVCSIFGKSHPPSEATQTQGLRDLTGDGIPDYYDATLPNSFPITFGNPRIWIGTGTGFRPFIPIDSLNAKFQFSHVTEDCGGITSLTDGGLYDIDGDGKPEVIGLCSSSLNQCATSGNNFVVSHLVGGRVFGTPESGRLTGIDNGYGAKTTVNYVSAKQYPVTNQVPFPEIVVSSVSTAGTHNLGGTLDGFTYAYSGAELVFDSALDRFVFPGYARHVAVQLLNSQTSTGPPTGKQVLGNPITGSKTSGTATITDSWTLAPFSNSMTKQQRWRREALVGRPRDVITTRWIDNPDPWPLLNLQVTDSRVIGETQYDWDAKFYETPFTPPANPIDCFDIIAPLDFDKTVASLTSDSVDVCRAHGFTFQTTTSTWRGDAAPPSDKNIQTRTKAISVDDYGRPVITEYDNDVFRSDDDYCVENKFATPIQQYPRVLSALSSRRTYACGETNTFASESWLYDNLTPGVVSDGRITSHSTDRRATDTGALLNTIHEYDATYDNDGNLYTVRTQRDNAIRTITFGYDTFGLVPTRVNRDATGVPSDAIVISYDPISMLPLASTDPNNNRRGFDYDGFGRPVRSTITPAGVPTGVLSTASYLGFDGNDPEGKRISLTEFPDPVDPASLSTTPGRTSVRHFDELGRAFRMNVSLGGDYGNQSLIAGWKAFDGAGRLSFAADPFPATEAATNAYGRSFYYKDTGDIDCIVRGHGYSYAATTATDLASERFPTCFNRSFAGHLDTVDVQDASSLQATSPQAGVVKRVWKSAIGLTLNRSTLRGVLRLEDEAFTYDRLGQWASVTRFLRPAHNRNAGPVQWTVRRDSLGQTLQLNEPGQATRTYSYSDWGERVETDWMDGSTRRSMTNTYDSLSRVLSADERSNGVVDPYTADRYVYDTPVSLSPLVNPTFVTGHLASAISARGTVAFSYDAFGRVNARVFTDEQGGIYIDRADHHTDGSLRSRMFNLPDAGYAPEAAQYSYDSGGRLRTVTYSDSTGSRNLYSASDIDVFGRVTGAQLGATAYQASYAPGGRRLIQETAIRSSSGSRRTVFGHFDPEGRELSRQEISDDSASGPTTTLSYDSLGRLATAMQTNAAASAFNWTYEYDALGNIGSLSNKQGNTSTTLAYDSLDEDRLCHVSYADNQFGSWLNGVVGNLPAPYLPCNVQYDSSGSIITEPGRKGTRQLSYFASGNVRTIAQGNQKASFAYDAFGQLQTLDLEGTSGAGRHDRHYGDLIEHHYTSSGGGGTYGKDANPVGAASFITRNIPGPGGILASRRGVANDWVYAFGELRGTRVSANQDGNFVQKIDYQPYGEAKSTGAGPATLDYTSYQWNGGDALAGFGLARLGARIYDPEIGRFLSRDPLLVPQTASTSNPYAFADNDPWNGADPSGLCIGPECDYLNSLSPFGIGLLFAGIDALANSGNGGHASGAPQATPPLSAEMQLRVDVIASTIASGTHGPPSNYNFHTLAALHFTAAQVLDNLKNSPERDYEVDAYNAGLDRIANTSRVVGFTMFAVGSGVAAAAEAGGFLLASYGYTTTAELLVGAPSVAGGLAAGGAAAAGANEVEELQSIEASAASAGSGPNMIGRSGGYTYSYGFSQGEAASNADNVLVLGKYPGNVDFVSRTPGTVTVDVPSGWTPTYNAGFVRGFMEGGGNIRLTSGEATGTFAIELQQLLTIPGMPE